MRHTISVLVENKFGVLARVAGLFSGRGFNIDSLSVAEATARVEWQPLMHFLLTAGGSVMYLKTEGTIGSRDVELDQTLYGRVIGIGIPF